MKLETINSRAAKRLVIWAHSECRSTAVLYAEAKRLAEARGMEVTMCLWGLVPMREERLVHAYPFVRVGDDLAKERAVLREKGGRESVQVFCVYQNSAAWRELMVEAKAAGARVVVYAEAPCEMCLGVKGGLKRLYYRWVLPRKVRRAVQAADLMISQSGVYGRDRLVRLGWRVEAIVPFGYASPRLEGGAARDAGRGEADALRVLHLGVETPYRAVGVAIEARRRTGARLVRTGGGLSPREVVDAIRAADVVVGCGLCEPWGMRINDALLEGVPVVVSDGMGVRWAVEKYGCGCVVPRGDAKALAAVLRRCREEPEFLAHLRSGAQVAAQALLPENRAAEWLDLVLGEEEK